jgi:hypothetical protein
MVRSDANGEQLAHNPLLNSLRLQSTPDYLCSRCGVIDSSAFRILFFCILINRHPTQILLKGGRILAKIVQ